MAHTIRLLLCTRSLQCGSERAVNLNQLITTEKKAWRLNCLCRFRGLQLRNTQPPTHSFKTVFRIVSPSYIHLYSVMYPACYLGESAHLLTIIVGWRPVKARIHGYHGDSAVCIGRFQRCCMQRIFFYSQSWNVAGLINFEKRTEVKMRMVFVPTLSFFFREIDYSIYWVIIYCLG